MDLPQESSEELLTLESPPEIQDKSPQENPAEETPPENVAPEVETPATNVLEEEYDPVTPPPPPAPTEPETSELNITPETAREAEPVEEIPPENVTQESVTTEEEYYEPLTPSPPPAPAEPENLETETPSPENPEEEESRAPPENMTQEDVPEEEKCAPATPPLPSPPSEPETEPVNSPETPSQEETPPETPTPVEAIKSVEETPEPLPEESVTPTPVTPPPPPEATKPSPKTPRLDCKVCGVKKPSPVRLRVHLQLHRGPQKIFKCPVCSVRFPSMFYLNNHKRVVHNITKRPRTNPSPSSSPPLGKGRHECLCCGIRKPSRVLLMAHMIGHKEPSKAHKCGVCNARFPSMFYLNNHTRLVHQISTTRKAAVVPPTPEKMKQLLRKLKSPKKPKSPTTPPVKEEPTTPTAEPQVGVVVTPRRKHQCKFCGTQFRGAHSHNSHMRWCQNKYPSVNGDASATPTSYAAVVKRRKLYECKICHRVFPTHRHLNSHARVHKVTPIPPPPSSSSTGGSSVGIPPPIKQKPVFGDVKPPKVYTCAICLAEFPSHFHYNSHARVHKPGYVPPKHPRPPRPPKMEATLASVKLEPRNSNRIRNYAQFHQSGAENNGGVVGVVEVKVEPQGKSPRGSKKKHYQCDKCAYAAKENVSLALHRRLMHEEMVVHQCGQCWKSFPTQRKLKLHTRLEHNNKVERETEVEKMVNGDVKMNGNCEEMMMISEEH